jgi:SAM-dependent methyltransferase
MPLRVPRSVSVRYVDRLPARLLREQYPELDGHSLVEPDIVDDGEVLSTVGDASVDFVIANHLIEHCEDPIGALQNYVRVLRPGGILFMAVPDKRRTFDRARPLTEFSHLVRDHDEGAAWSRAHHYEEWARFVERVDDAHVPQRAEDLQRRGYSIHFHTFTPDSFFALLWEGRSRFAVDLELEALECYGHEFIVILRRRDPAVLTARG